jgi:nicotinate phosphoribosyltransferase
MQNRRDEPITQSLLDIDKYKLTMLRFIFHYFRGVPVKFSAMNRTKSVRIADTIDEGELRAELDYVTTLRFTENELEFIAMDPHLNDPQFLSFLSELRLPPLFIEKDKKNGAYIIEAIGAWEDVTLWETIVLHTEAELHARLYLRGLTQREVEGVYDEGNRRLSQKIALFKRRPDVRFMEFGTRRRWSQEWQRHVLERFSKEIPQNLVGTSNILHAMELGLVAGGTKAHETDMALFGIRFDPNDPGCVARSHSELLDKWRELYGNELSIALSDTYGTDFFLRTLTDKQAREWQGFRQDSGSPFECGEKIIAEMWRRGIDPMTKKMIPSDGLTTEKMIEITDYFAGRLLIPFSGWGTNATNDLGFPALSLVMKLVEANGNPTVKLSDNLAKAMGPTELVEWVKQSCGYTNTLSETLTY